MHVNCPQYLRSQYAIFITCIMSRDCYLVLIPRVRHEEYHLFYTNNLRLLKLEALPTAPLEALGEYSVTCFDLCQSAQSPQELSSEVGTRERWTVTFHNSERLIVRVRVIPPLPARVSNGFPTT